MSYSLILQEGTNLAYAMANAIDFVTKKHDPNSYYAMLIHLERELDIVVYDIVVYYDYAAEDLQHIIQKVEFSSEHDATMFILRWS